MASENTPFLTKERGSIFSRNYLKWSNICRCCLCNVLIIIICAILLITVFYSVNTISNSIGSSNNSSQSFPLYNTTWPLKDDAEFFSEENIHNSSDIENAINMGLKSLSERKFYERTLPKMDIDSPAYRHQMSMKTTKRATTLTTFGFILEMGAKELTKCVKNQSNELCEKWSVHDSARVPLALCNTESEIACEPSPYRTLDGSCNNLRHPKTWGVAMNPFRRILPPAYADGISAARSSAEGELPSAREVSLKVHRALYVKDLDFTVMLAVWGQFVDHDMTATAISQGLNGEPITCCQSEKDQHPECYVVRLGLEDPFYKEYNVTCMEFVRSAPAPLCRLGPREQLNQASSFIDGSAIYGNNADVLNSLRMFKNGELKMLRTPNGEELLPVSMDFNDGCNRNEQFKRGRYCFLTGDLRSNENLHLTSMHLIFARQHNFIARQLGKLNPHWNDDKIFQESRKILVAQIQHITYNEFLPAILPNNLLMFLNISLQSKGYFSGYSSSINPTIANSFAASVFRFGHSLLPGLMKLISNDTSSKEFVELHKMLFNPFGLYDKDFLEKIIRGALNTSVAKSDIYFTKEVTENLFVRDKRKRGPCGLDLVSLNIQRGRDHGLPGYAKWRIPCGLEEIKSFDDLNGIFDNDSFYNIKKIYKSVDDIDLFTGGLAEIPIKGGLLGPTFTCLFADQFLRLKVGDRYWYETAEKPQQFNPVQLEEIRKTSLAKILCDNSYINQTQPMVMRRIGKFNMRRSCMKLASPNFYAWKEFE